MFGGVLYCGAMTWPGIDGVARGSEAGAVSEADRDEILRLLLQVAEAGANLDLAAISVETGVVRPLERRIRRLERLVEAHHAVGVMDGRLVGDPCPVCEAKAPLEDRLMVQAAKFDAVLADLARRNDSTHLMVEQANVHRLELERTRDLLKEARVTVLDPDRQEAPSVSSGHQSRGDTEGADS